MSSEKEQGPLPSTATNLTHDPEAAIRDKRIVVTGAAGFIGSHLMAALHRGGAARLVGVDSLAYGARRSLGALPAQPGVSLLERDISALDAAALDDVLRGADVLFHLAAEKHNQALDAPERVLAVNVVGSHRLFAAAARAGVGKVVFTSSLYAYGRTGPPAMRAHERERPTTVYGISKLAGEQLLAQAAGSAMAHTAVRLFFIYGPRQFAGAGYKSVIVRNFERILRGEAPVVLGDGAQALDYTYVDDAVDALIRAADPAAGPGPINVCSGTAVSVNELTDLMLQVAQSPLRPVHGPPDSTAGTLRVGCNERARERLGWRPRMPLTEGLRHVYGWMRDSQPDV